ncbi:MAG: hypothetical protein COB41_01290 [Proteobacteria bacterium]|nr:GDYXXLXY domain-containing protein [bacterium AH-315-G11]PCI45484.1 MAG: hypothetical protein COB41_01290 [Pseudomonadota bacterium]
MNQSKAILIIVVVLTLTLVGMIAKKQYTLNTGALVVLKTTPVDPRSLFRGDYVRLNYAISRLNVNQFPLLHELEEHDPVFVALKKQGVFWQPIAVFKSMPEAENDTVVIKGYINSSSRGGWNAQVSIRYGIENYFVPEGEGRDLEGLRNQGNISMRIAVDGFGNSGIKAVLLNGESIYVEALF